MRTFIERGFAHGYTVRMSSGRRAPRWIWATLVLASLVTWWPVWNEPFAEDDFLYLEVTGSASPAQLLGYFVSEGVMDHHYRPLSDPLWYALARTPVRYHLGLQLMHVIAALLICSLGNAIGLRPGAAFAGALLWATRDFAFPSMIWASGASDLGSTVLALGSLRAYAAARAGGRIRATLGSVALFVAALLTKETAIVTLALFPIVHRLAGHGEGTPPAWRSTARPLVPYALVGLPLAALQIGLARFADIYGQSLYALSAGLHTLWLWPVYALWCLLAWPAVTQSIPILVLLVLGSAGMLALGWVRSVRSVEGSTTLLLGAGWFTVAVLPALFAPQRINTNYVMLAAAGPCLALGAFLHARLARPAAACALALLVAAGPALVLAKDAGWVPSGGWVDPVRARRAAALVDTVCRRTLPAPPADVLLLLFGAVDLNPMLIADLGAGFAPQSGLQAAFRRAYGRTDIRVATLASEDEMQPAQLEAFRRELVGRAQQIRVLQVGPGIVDVTTAVLAAARTGSNVDDFRRALTRARAAAPAGEPGSR